MRKLIVTEWVSLDGVFDAALMQQWFNPYHSDSRAKYIQDTINSCDVMLYGRITYEMLYPYWSAMKNNEMGVADKLNKTKKYVVSATMKSAPWENSTMIKNDPVKEINLLKQQGDGDILIQGSATLVKSLLAANLVDELKLLMHPYIMGTGKRFFIDEMNAALSLNDVKAIENGVILLTYNGRK